MLREQESEIEKMIMENERLRMENLKLKELLKCKREKSKMLELEKQNRTQVS